MVVICIVSFSSLQSSLSIQLQYKLPSLLTQQRVKLVVVDSMAALFRVEFSGEQASQRAQLLRSFGAQLRKLSDSFSTAVVCVNQVDIMFVSSCTIIMSHLYSMTHLHTMAHLHSMSHLHTITQYLNIMKLTNQHKDIEAQFHMLIPILLSGY